MNYKIIGVLAALTAGAGLLFVPQPSLDARLNAVKPELERILAADEVRVDPGELLDNIYNNNVALRILDVRKEADFNLFHIIDSEFVKMDQIRDPFWVKKLPLETVLVLVSNDEVRAVKAWKYLATQRVQNIYILRGGINFWLDLYHGEPKTYAEINALLPSPGGGSLRYRFDAALGARHPASDPDPKHVAKRKYTTKVKQIGKAAAKSGGCG